MLSTPTGELCILLDLTQTALYVWAAATFDFSLIITSTVDLDCYCTVSMQPRPVFTKLMQRKSNAGADPRRCVDAVWQQSVFTSPNKRTWSLNLSMRMLMLDAEVQRQWRKRGMRVTIIRIVINFPPEKAYNVALRIGDLKYCFQQGFKPRRPECFMVKMGFAPKVTGVTPP